MKKVIIVHLGEVFGVNEDVLDDQTPLEAANTPHLDYIQSSSYSGTMKKPNINDSFFISSLLSLIFGTGTSQHSSVLLADGMNCELKENDIVFKNNFVSLKPTAKSLSVIDPVGSLLSSEEKKELTEFLNSNLFKNDDESFFLNTDSNGESVFVYRKENLERRSVSFDEFNSPYEYIGREIDMISKMEEQSKRFMYIMNESQMLLSKHPFAVEKYKGNFFFPNSVWFYEGAFVEKLNPNRSVLPFDKASIVSSNLILKGLSQFHGMQYISWEDFEAKNLKENEFMFIDKEEGNNQIDPIEKVNRLESLDNQIEKLTEQLSGISTKVLFLFNYPYSMDDREKSGCSFFLTEFEKNKYVLPRKKITLFDLLCLISNAISPPKLKSSGFIEEEFKKRKSINPEILGSKILKN